MGTQKTNVAESPYKVLREHGGQDAKSKLEVTLSESEHLGRISQFDKVLLPALKKAIDGQ